MSERRFHYPLAFSGRWKRPSQNPLHNTLCRTANPWQLSASSIAFQKVMVLIAGSFGTEHHDETFAGSGSDYIQYAQSAQMNHS